MIEENDSWDGYPIADIEEPELAGTVVTHFYVHYSADGLVHSLGNFESPDYKNYKIDINLIKNFVEGKKDPTKFDIEYFYNISKGLIVDNEDRELAVKTETLLYTIPRTAISSDEILIEHDEVNEVWTVSARDGLEEKLSIISSIAIFVCKRNDPHFLYASYFLDPKQLIGKNIVLPFQTEIERSYKDVTLTTLKKFNSYGVKEI